MPTPRACKRCGVALARETQLEPKHHETKDACIKALRTLMVNQQRIASDMGMDMALHFLRVLEELALDPDAGYQFTVHDSREGKLMVVPPQHVSGIFASILSRYRKQADWTPMEDLRRAVAGYAAIAGKLTSLVIRVLERQENSEYVSFDEEFVATLRAAVEEAEQFAAPLRGPSRSLFRRR